MNDLYNSYYNSYYNTLNEIIFELHGDRLAKLNINGIDFNITLSTLMYLKNRYTNRSHTLWFSVDKDDNITCYDIDPRLFITFIELFIIEIIQSFIINKFKKFKYVYIIVVLKYILYIYKTNN